MITFKGASQLRKQGQTYTNLESVAHVVFHRESSQFPTNSPNGLHLLALRGMDLLQKSPFFCGRHDMLTARHFIGILLVGLVKVNVLSVSVLIAKEAGAVAHHLNGAYHRLPTAGNTITLVSHGREMEALI